MNRLLAAALATALLPTICSAQSAPAKHSRRTIAAISAVQEQAPFSPEQMDERRKDFGDDEEAVAADSELNGWKLCVLDSIARWAPLKEGPSTVADGAFGRCADTERRYRDHLIKLSQDGHAQIDPQMARGLLKSLEDAWRSRVVAAVLDQKLAALAAAPPADVAPPK